MPAALCSPSVAGLPLTSQDIHRRIIAISDRELIIINLLKYIKPHVDKDQTHCQVFLNENVNKTCTESILGRTSHEL